MSVLHPGTADLTIEEFPGVASRKETSIPFSTGLNWREARRAKGNYKSRPLRLSVTSYGGSHPARDGETTHN